MPFGSNHYDSSSPSPPDRYFQDTQEQANLVPGEDLQACEVLLGGDLQGGDLQAGEALLDKDLQVPGLLPLLDLRVRIGSLSNVLSGGIHLPSLAGEAVPVIGLAAAVWRA